MKLKVRDGDGVDYVVDCELEERSDCLRVFFPYHELLKDELKAAFAARWGMLDRLDPQKCWDLPRKPRTTFRLQAMQWGGVDGRDKPLLGSVDPYARYRKPLEYLPCPPRPYNGVVTEYYSHQPPAVAHVWTRRQCILAYDMGLGKTLIVGRVMEECREKFGWQNNDFLYVCKNGALHQVQLDFIEWGIGVRPRFVSFETMRDMVASWSGPAPRFVVFDESTCLKTPTAQRSKQALHLADSMREEYGEECFVVLMTGTPSPKSPADWWHQCEVACPGFLREGSIEAFKRRVGVSELQNREDGGAYNKLVGWLDDERKCKVCCKMSDDPVHSKEQRLNGEGHPWQASKNEVKAIYGRLKGLVDVKFKKDCLDLPEKVHRIIRVKPTQMVLNAAKLLVKKATGAAQAMVLTRELSDGFQYVETPVGRIKCPTCAGSGTMLYSYDPEHPEEPVSQGALITASLVEGTKDCDECSGAGEVDEVKRTTSIMPCPKDDVLLDLLEEHQDVGRIAIYAGFTGSVDRVTSVCLKAGWSVIRVDGRGWTGMVPQGHSPLPSGGKELYALFRYGLKDYPTVAVVAQASTAAHGLNFDVCPTIVNFSRDFNGENSMQLEERNRRGKIKETLKKHGLTHTTIVDIVHLETDMLVIKNHEAKRKLQAMTLGEVASALGG